MNEQLTSVTGYTSINENGKLVPSDPRGNNAAIVCGCGRPVLITVWGGHKGSSEGKPATCRGCGTQHWAVRSDLLNVFVVRSK